MVEDVEDAGIPELLRRVFWGRAGGGGGGGEEKQWEKRGGTVSAKETES